ncbi:MAG: hypothetical protein NTU95_11700 [Methanothrix sp.]|nr:hypothetical protein [Methanothrix sp.]
MKTRNILTITLITLIACGLAGAVQLPTDPYEKATVLMNNVLSGVGIAPTANITPTEATVDLPLGQGVSTGEFATSLIYILGAYSAFVDLIPGIPDMQVNIRDSDGKLCGFMKLTPAMCILPGDQGVKAMLKTIVKTGGSSMNLG